MYTRHVSHIASICTSLLLSTSISADTLFVTNLDDGIPGSLRATIAAASGGDVIKFSVVGTILLDETLGELVIDKELTIDGQNNIIVDGQNQINIGFRITGASASNSIIQNITIQNFNGHEVDPGSGTGPVELPAYGILINNNANNCSVIATTIKHIHSGIDEEAVGINIFSILGLLDATNIINNKIMFVSSEDNPGGDSGGVRGIFIFGSITENCSNNTIYNLTSGDADSSGNISGILVINIEGNCSHNTIYNLTGGDSSGDSRAIRGLFITDNINNNCSFNTIYNLTSGNSATDNSGLVSGIFIGSTIEGNCSHNTLSGFTSGNAVSASGSITGISSATNGLCSCNRITNFASGSTTSQAGEIVGISVGIMRRTCSNNIIQHFTIGDTQPGTQIVLGVLFGIRISIMKADCLNNHISDLSANDTPTLNAGGIVLKSNDPGHLIACNTVERITGGNGSITFGIQLEEGDDIVLRNNTINSLVGTNGPAHGILLEDTAGATFITNSLVSFNSISNITGSANNGFGISITQALSVGNDLLNNSIFNINGKAINIIDNGVPVDGTVTLQSAVCGAQTLFVHGTLEPDPNFEESEFLLQFFASTQGSPPQAMIFLGEAIIQADDTTPFTVKIKSCQPVNSDQYITATATALLLGTGENNNTSEVSNTIPGCDNDFICALATTLCDLEPPPCPIFIAQ